MLSIQRGRSVVVVVVVVVVWYCSSYNGLIVCLFVLLFVSVALPCWGFGFDDIRFVLSCR
jgi:hypothetical protein